ncbi:aspartate-semialdehyde dehydrogenase [Candidatus Woesearchaeota archaeon]|nr:aspartate-semialdehyde dehydrogenase [Candidatus Woesearchaeota archaeon]
MTKLPTAILGATGAAGLEFIRALSNHPLFQVEGLYASERSKGRALEDICILDEEDIPKSLRRIRLKDCNSINPENYGLICSALPSEVAREYESHCARTTPVISTSAAHRYEEDVPLMITEINAGHAVLLEEQKKNRGWKGWIAPGPNCTTVGLAMSLAPLMDACEVEHITMSSYQAISGGGAALIEKWGGQQGVTIPQPISPFLLKEGPLSPDKHISMGESYFLLEGNVIGYIKDEEGKVIKEARKILGTHTKGNLFPREWTLDCSCVRVPVLQGHFETVFVRTRTEVTPADVKELYAQFNEKARAKYAQLPSSPKNFITVLERSPHPRLDVNLDGGMSAIIGRIEPLASGHGVKYQVLSNNLVRGAAKGIVHVAEYLYSERLL